LLIKINETKEMIVMYNFTEEISSGNAVVRIDVVGGEKRNRLVEDIPLAFATKGKQSCYLAAKLTTVRA